MTEDQQPLERGSPDRRSSDRQIAVLINAALCHKGRDGLCRIRNLSTGGAMIESAFPLDVNDRVTLRLRSGHQVEGEVRWIGDGCAGLSFVEPDAVAIIQGGAQERRLHGPEALIGGPVFRRAAWCRVATANINERAAVQMISPTGLLIDTTRSWGAGRLFSVTIDGLGEHAARIAHHNDVDGDELLPLVFVQPLHYRLFNEWLASTPASGDVMPMSDVIDSTRWT